jgi:hypothetical protein
VFQKEWEERRICFDCVSSYLGQAISTIEECAKARIVCFGKEITGTKVTTPEICPGF